MIYVRIKNKLKSSCLYGVILIISSCSVYGKKASNCIKLEKNNICLAEHENDYGENVYYLLLNSKKYPEISYYENAKIRKLNNIDFNVITSFSEQGNTTIQKNLYLKNNNIVVKGINTSTTVNIYPKGVVENCYVELNKEFSKDLKYYVDNYIFNLNEVEKKKICKQISNKK